MSVDKNTFTADTFLQFRRPRPSSPARPKSAGLDSETAANFSGHSVIQRGTTEAIGAGDPSRTLLYAQQTNGTMYRWVADNGGWRSTGGVGGLSTVKSMALISRTATYETFIANTRAGTLVTVTWPTSYLSVPKSAVVRSSTWQGFEQLIATNCGANGTLLLGIDRDTKSGYLYAVGHAAGGSTVIKSLGKVPMTFSDPQYFRWAPKYDNLNGA